MTSELTVLSEAQRLHALGLSPIPLQYGQKRPFGSWARLQYTRLHPDLFPSLFSEQHVNIGLVCGSVSRGLFSIDADTPASWEWLCGELTGRGIKTWLRSSPRGGQALFLALDGPAKSEARKGYQIIGEGGLVVVPPSIRSDTGEIVEWLETPDREPLSVCLSDLSFLSLGRARRRSRVASREVAEKAGALPEVADRVLIERNIERYGEDNSRAEFAACLSLLGAGWEVESILRLFSRIRPPHFAAVGVDRFAHYVLGPAHKQYTRASPGRAQDGTGHGANAAFCDRLLARIKVTPFQSQGRQATTLKAVMMGLVARMRVDGHTVFRASRREVSSITNISEKTAGRALDRLTKDGFLLRHGADKVSGSYLWEILTERLAMAPDSDLTTLNMGIDAVRLGDLSGDIWHRSALGKAALHVFNYLLANKDEGSTIAMMVRAGIGAYNTIQRAVRKLEGADLAYAEGNIWYAVTHISDLDLAMHSLEHTIPNTGATVYGAGERRKKRHERERSMQASLLYLGQMRRTLQGELP